MQSRISPDWVTAIATVVALGISLLALLISHRAGKRQERLSAAAMESQRSVAAEALRSQEKMAADAMVHQQAMFREERREALRQATNLQLLAGRNDLYADLLQLSEEQPEGDELIGRLSALACRVEVFASRQVTRTFHRIKGEAEFAMLGIVADDEPRGAAFGELAAVVQISKAATSVLLRSGQSIRESDTLEQDDENVTSEEVSHFEEEPPTAAQE